MKKAIMIVLCICFTLVGCNSNQYNIENQYEITWYSKHPDIQFSFNDKAEYGSEGHININNETIPIIVIAGRKNFLYFKDARNYTENSDENFDLFYGIYSCSDSYMTLKIKKDYVFNNQYDKIIFNKE